MQLKICHKPIKRV